MNGAALVLVGVTMGVREGRPAINALYLHSLEAAGMAPVLLAPLMGAPVLRALLDSCRGVVLTGGADIDPTRYGEPAHERVVGVSPERDEMEVAVFALASERQLPILAICRGMQLVNVALGGSLHQHIPDALSSEIDHQQHPAPRHEATHDVSVEEGCRLATVLGASSLRVNSMHHQSLNRVAADLRPVAWAPDGLIEGVEAADRSRWLLGVQWHPEELTASHEHARRLFDAFAFACRAG